MLFAVNKLRKERAISSKCVETLFWKNSASPTHTHSPTISTENRLPIMTLRFLGKDKWVLDIHSPSSFGRNRGILERWWEYLGSWVVGRLMWRPLFLGAWVKWGTVENQCKWWNLLLSWTAYVDDHQVQVRLLMSSFETFFFFFGWKHYSLPVLSCCF